MRVRSLLLAFALLLAPAHAEPGVGPFSPVMTSPAAPNRRALIVAPSFDGGGATPRGALARSDADAYRALLRLLGFAGTVVAADTRPALRDAVRSFADALPRDAEVAVFVLGTTIASGGRLYVPASDLPASDRTAERIATAGIDLAEILSDIAGHGPREVVAVVDECGGGEAKPSCDIGPKTVPDGVSAIVVHRESGQNGSGPLAGVATARQDLLPLMREPGLDFLRLYGKLKGRLDGTNDGLAATAALSRGFTFLPGDFLARLPIECNRVDPAADAEALRRAPSLAPAVAACERAASTYDFSPFFRDRLAAAREQLAFQKAVAGCAGEAATAYLGSYPNGSYRFAVDDFRSSCERARQPPPAAQVQPPAVETSDARDQSLSEGPETRPKRVYVLDDIPDRVLKLRDGPGSHYRPVTAMPSGTDDIYVTGECRKGDADDKWPWCQVTWRNVTGWASSCCLAPRALVKAGDGRAGLFEVPEDVPDGSLHLRAGPSYGSQIVSSIPAASTNLVVGQCRRPSDGKGKPYCQVSWHGFRGWASSNYLRASSAVGPGARR